MTGSALDDVDQFLDPRSLRVLRGEMGSNLGDDLRIVLGPFEDIGDLVLGIHRRKDQIARARDLVLPAVDPQDKIADIFERPEYYSQVVAEIRAHLATEHSQRARIQELID